ncbi:MAG: glycosyltransferase [Candidatus Kerfeldbacteria bacterium]
MEELNKIKKILLVTTWAPPMTGGSVNLSTIFSQFHSDSYSILTSYRIITSVMHNSSDWLPCRYYYYDQPKKNNYKCADCVNNIHNKRQINVINQNNKDKKNNQILKIKQLLNFKGIYNLIIFFYQIIIITYQGIKTIRKEKTEILIATSGDGLAMISTYLIHILTKKPYTLYFFDIYYGNNFLPSINLLSKFAEPIIVRNAKKIFFTNQGTDDLYKKRYGILPTEIIYNSIFSKSYTRVKELYKPKPPFKIIFTGHIYWPQEQSVLNLIEAVKKIQNIKIELYLYSLKTPDIIKETTKDQKNIFLGIAHPSEIAKIQLSADILFLPLAWNTPSPEIIRTATPGKLTEYLISGKPILIHAPKYAYVSKYAKENKFGLVIDNNNIDNLQEGIIKLLTDIKYSNTIINNANKTFYQNHDAIKNAKKLTNTLNNI